MKLFFNLVMEITYLFSRPKKGTLNIERRIEDMTHLESYIKDLNRQWIYVYDKWYGIRNHINVPPQAAGKITGDCDDYASHVYQVGRTYDAHLLTYFPKKISKAHTVTVFNLGQELMLVNWGRISYHIDVQSIKDNLEKYAKSEMISMHWAKYDYDKQKFITYKEPKIERTV